MSLRRAALAVPGDLQTLTGGYFYDRRLLEGLHSLGVDVAHIELPAGFPDPSPAERALAAAQLAAVAPDCALIVDGLALGAMDRASLAAVKAPLIALVHHPLADESGLDRKRRDALYRSERDVLEVAVAVIVTSPHTARALVERYGVPSERITVARPGVDRSPGEAQPVDPPLILSVGSTTRRKGHDVLLRALARIADRPWQAVIVGAARDAELAQKLAQLAAELRIADRLRFAGSVSAAELGALYRAASVFALATRHEGHGIVFDEAMVHGLPIVSCSVGAVPETVAAGAGRLVPVDDPEAFAQALHELLGDDALRETMAAASRRAGTELPAWVETASIVAAVIDRVAARG